MNSGDFPWNKVAKADLDAGFGLWPRRERERVRVGRLDDDLSKCRALMITGDDRDARRWQTLLPTLDQLELLYVRIRTDQAFLDAVGRLSRLRRLDLCWNRVEDLAPLAELKALTHLSLGASPRVRSLEPLRHLPALKALALYEDFSGLKSLDDLRGITSLQGLRLAGSDRHREPYESLEPLGSLAGLRFLLLTRIRVRRGGYAPLAALTGLEYLWLNPYDLAGWSQHDLELLERSLTGLRTDLLQRAARDADFRQAYGIG
jgi:hypothetical protein